MGDHQQQRPAPCVLMRVCNSAEVLPDLVARPGPVLEREVRHELMITLSDARWVAY
jgi:hypothetical protein